MILPCSEGIGEPWFPNCCVLGEKGWGDAVDTLCGTLPGRIWFAMIGDGLAFADPFACRCGKSVGSARLLSLMAPDYCISLELTRDLPITTLRSISSYCLGWFLF